MRKSDLLTPALLLDLDQFEANLRRLAAHAASHGKQLRPHAKAHKCVEIARRQLALGAVGVCVATVSELEWMGAAGFPGILLTSPIASASKAARIARLAASVPDLAVVIDHPRQIEIYESVLEAPVGALVDLDVGDHRTGIPCDERAMELAIAVDRSPSLKLRGVQAYSVSGSHASGLDARRAHSFERLAPAVEAFRAMRSRGLPVEIFSGGSTGTWDIDTAIPEFTELQAGSYVGMDIAYRNIGVDFAPAMSVLATVVSASHPGRVTVDAGFKAFSTDRPFPPSPPALPGVRYQWAGDEFGFLLFETDPPVALGDQVEFDPPHCDPTANLYDRIHVCRGGNVEDIWPLKGATINP
jgi:D-serine deaminase-like pyridoxal phosphate-dependent protein